MPVLFDVEVNDEGKTEVVSFVSLGDDPTEDPFIERQFVEDAIQLRDSDAEAFEFVWDLILLALDRGAPKDALDA